MNRWPLCLALIASAAAETHRVVGENYYHTFSAAHPVLVRIRPGDTVETKTVDSAGFDLRNVRRTKTHGNPLTGAIFIEGAARGDTLEVHLNRVRLNRNSGYTGYQVGVGGIPAELAAPKPRADAAVRGYDYLVPWFLDLKANRVRLAEPRGKAALDFAAEPMLGCIGVAPEGDFSPRSGPAGYWGGNLDYNRIREGATVLLPVFHTGGLLFFGDGHALQGDGEAVGSGVETSLDVTVTVRLRKGWTISGPRLETTDEIVSIGAKPEAKLNETMEMATRDMLAWLVRDHGVEPREAHLLLGVAARYDLITLGGSVGLRIPRAALPRR